MRVPRLIAGAVIAVFAATGGAVTPAQAAAPVRGPKLLVPAVKAVHSGRPTWVKAYWSTSRDICDAKVTVQVAATDILYPSNTETYTSFYRGDTLDKGATDYTAFRVTTTVDHTIVRAIRLTMAYRAESEGGCGGPVLSRDFYATLAVRKG